MIFYFRLFGKFLGVGIPKFKNKCSYKRCLKCVHTECETGRIARDLGFIAYRRYCRILLESAKNDLN